MVYTEKKKQWFRATANTEVTLTFFQEKKIGREADIALTFRSNFQIVKYTPYCKLVVKRTEVVTYHLTCYSFKQYVKKGRYSKMFQTYVKVLNHNPFALQGIGSCMSREAITR